MHIFGKNLPKYLKITVLNFFTLTRIVCFFDTYTVMEILTMHDKIKEEGTLGKVKKLLSNHAYFREKPPEIFKITVFNFFYFNALCLFLRYLYDKGNSYNA